MKTQTEMRPLVSDILQALDEAFKGCSFAANCAYRHDILATFCEFQWCSAKQLMEENPAYQVGDALKAYAQAGFMLDQIKPVWEDQNYGIGIGKQVLKMISEVTNDLGDADWMFREIQAQSCLSLYRGLKAFGENKGEEGKALFDQLADDYRQINNQISKAVNLELEVANAVA